jgi:hypothetical protein
MGVSDRKGRRRKEGKTGWEWFWRGQEDLKRDRGIFAEGKNRGAGIVLRGPRGRRVVKG